MEQPDVYMALIGGGIGIWELMIILLIIIIIFGAGRAPKVISGLAEGVRDFKAALSADPTKDDDDKKKDA